MDTWTYSGGAPNLEQGQDMLEKDTPEEIIPELSLDQEKGKE